MEIAKIRKMSKEELSKSIIEGYTELKNIGNDLRTGKEKDSTKSLKIKRNIARMLTVLNEGSFTKSEESKSKDKKK